MEKVIFFCFVSFHTHSLALSVYSHTRVRAYSVSLYVDVSSMRSLDFKFAILFFIYFLFFIYMNLSDLL